MQVERVSFVHKPHCPPKLLSVPIMLVSQLERSVDHFQNIVVATDACHVKPEISLRQIGMTFEGASLRTVSISRTLGRPTIP